MTPLQQEQRQKTLALMNAWRADWNKFTRDVLGVTLDAEQQAILSSVQHNPRTSVMSGTARGKDFVAACAAVSFLYLTPRWNTRRELVENTKVALTAPCYDDTTEVLTDNGWKLFKDLLPTDKVAQKGKDNLIEFVYPLDYIVAPYDGYMVGCSSKLVDFLVTPKHRCLFKSQMTKEFSVGQAGDIYGMYGQFVKEAKWRRSAKNADLDWFEFLGFWFAEGSAQYNGRRRRYRITLTQNSTEYVDGLIKRNGAHFKNKFHKYKKKSGGYNWELYQKDISEEFVRYGKALSKSVPKWVKEAGTEELLAFIKGFLIGDGTIDKNGCQKLCTSSLQLANDLHEMAVKAGLIANLKKYTSQKRKVLHDDNGYITGWKFVEGVTTYYEVKLSKRGRFPKVTKKHWHKEYYNGYVYCVKVPSGMVMVRRNGYNHWSGNTDRQVKNIMIPEVSRLYNRAKQRGIVLPGRLNAYDIRTDNEEWFLTGFKADEHNHEAWSGFHAVHTMFVITEASGIGDDTFSAIEGNLQGDSRILLVFNPNTPVGYAARSQRGNRWAKFRLNSLTAPNVLQRRLVIPGQVDYAWVVDKISEWCVPINAEDRTEEFDDFEFEGKWYRPEDLFRKKVLGKFPKVADDVLIPQQWIEAAQERWKLAHGKEPVSDELRLLGVDVAGMGRDSTCFCERKGKWVAELQSRNSGGQADHMAVAGDIAARRRRHPRMVVSIDTIGEGAGVFSRCIELDDKRYIISCKYSEGAKQFDRDLSDITGQYKFVNMRAYLFWCVRDWLNPKNETGAMLPPDSQLAEEATEIRWTFRSDGKIIIEPKEDIKKRLGRSPDKFDALANTFYPVRSTRQAIDLDRLSKLV